MEIRFYTYTGEKNVINKKLNSYTSTFINIKYQDLDVTAPTFLLKFIDYPNYNYLYVPTLKRYYFIDSINIKTENVYEIRCTCDVLESFKEDILNSNGLLTKSENVNAYYGEYKSLNKKIINHYYSDKIININSTDKILITLGS